MERWLTQRQKEIDGQFDFRYSVLPAVLGNMIRGGRLTEQDLHGLAEDQFNLIRRQVML